jgi:ribosome-associated protein
MMIRSFSFLRDRQAEPTRVAMKANLARRAAGLFVPRQRSHDITLRGSIFAAEHACFPATVSSARIVPATRLLESMPAMAAAAASWIGRSRGSRDLGCRKLSESSLQSEIEATADAESLTEDDPDVSEVLELIEEKLGQDVVVLSADKLPQMRMLCDFMIVLTCTSRRHMKVMGDHICEHFKLKGMLLDRFDENDRPFKEAPSIEGQDSEEWMLVDLNDIIVQIMSPEGRERFAIERHWTNMHREKLTE